MNWRAIRTAARAAAIAMALVAAAVGVAKDAVAGPSLTAEIQCDSPALPFIRLGTAVDCSILVQAASPMTGVYAVAFAGSVVCEPPCSAGLEEGLSITAASPPPNAAPPPYQIGWVPLGSGTMAAGESVKLALTIAAIRPAVDGEVYGACLIAFADGGHSTTPCIFPTVPADWDGDACGDIEEGGTDPELGGQRDADNFWDFFDVFTPWADVYPFLVRDGRVSGLDLFALLQRFGATGDPDIYPLSYPPPPPAYHTAFDRGPSSGPNPWNLTAADGTIAGTDFFAILAQFGHSCA